MTVRFRVAYTHKQLADEDTDQDVVVLEPSSWNDYGYVCTFRVVAFAAANHPVPLGEWKIAESRSAPPSKTKLPDEFTTLPKQFLSLGQGLGAYERLAMLPVARRLDILVGLRDLLVRPVGGIESTGVFQKALARFSKAQEVLRKRAEVLQRLELPSAGPEEGAGQREPIRLRVRARLQGFDDDHDVSLRLSGEIGAIGLLRSVVLVGPNGTGKTQLLAALARAFSGLEQGAVTVAPTHPFSATIALSYGAFDRFSRPRGGTVARSYWYRGLRGPDDGGRLVLDVDAALDRLRQSIQRLDNEPRRRQAWEEALRTADLLDVIGSLDDSTSIQHWMARLSAGQQIAAMAITDLASTLEPYAIVLYDEPETHLHPRLLSGLLRAMRQLLESFDAYAIIATHSLIPVQETPSSNVIVFRMFDDGKVTTGSASTQTFASSLDDIEREVFGVREGNINYQELLERLEHAHGAPRIEALLGGDLGLGASLALAALRR